MFRYLFPLFLLTAPVGARAADWYTGARTPVPDESWIVAVDSSLSVTSNSSVFADVAATAAPVGTLDESGVRVRVEGLAGTYSYRTGADRKGPRVRGDQEEGTASVGYAWVWQDAVLAGFVGLNVRNNDLSIPDPGNPVVGTKVGVKAALDFYANPTETTMVSAYGHYATTNNSYYTRLRAGFAVADRVYIGPEVAFLGDDFFRQWRVGGHVTGLRFGNLQFGLSAGYLNDRVQKSGFYTTVDVRSTF